jgi:hypothetical protein
LKLFQRFAGGNTHHNRVISKVSRDLCQQRFNVGGLYGNDHDRGTAHRLSIGIHIRARDPRGDARFGVEVGSSFGSTIGDANPGGNVHVGREQPLENCSAHGARSQNGDGGQLQS